MQMLTTSKKTSVFSRWLASYLVMVVLMLVASVGLYFYSYDIISKQQEKANEDMLEKVQIEVDACLDSAKATWASLLLEPDVERLTKNAGITMEDRQLLYDVYELLRNKLLAGENMEHIFLYLMHDDYVVSTEGYMSKALFYDLYYKNEAFSENEFYSLMEQKWLGNIVSIPNSKNQKDIILLGNSKLRGERELHATIGIRITSDEIIQRVNEVHWAENTEVIILEGERVLYSNGEINERLFEEYGITELTQTKLQKVEIDGEEYNLRFLVSEETGLCYGVLSPQKEIYQEARKIQIYMLVLLTTCLTIGVVVAYLLTRMNYKSFKEVMEAFGYYGNEGSGDEYEWLLEQKNVYHKEHQMAKWEINERKQVMRQQHLQHLISLPFDKRYQQCEELSTDKLFEKENILVFLLDVQALDHESMYAKMNRNMSRFVFKNILEEMLEERLTIEIVDMMDCFACIVNTEKNREECREILEEVLDEMQRYMKENMQLQVDFSFGAHRQGIDEVHSSYLLAREAAKYRNMISETPFIWFDDIKTNHTMYYYPSEIEQKIINAISVGNSEDVCAWIDEVMDINYHKREITQHMKKILLADLCGTLIKGAEQAGSAQYILQYINENPISDEWLGEWDEDTFRKYVHRLVNAICEDIRSNETTKSEDKQFGWQVMEYVKENYHNPDLNISITALHFGITPSYLSALFKEQTGLNLLEYINHIRVEQAKKLLEEDLSLVEICDKTGFRSSGALIRVFKKETGVTPGQMKKILGQTSKE